METTTETTTTTLPNEVIEPGVKKALPATLSNIDEVKHWLTVELGEIATGAKPMPEALTFSDIRLYLVEEFQGLIDTVNNCVLPTNN